MLEKNESPMQELKKRYLSLDVFRGLDVALMIIVNSPGNWSTAYAPLLHANWNGFTLTDLVFPTFLFVVGNAMSFSLHKYESLGNRAFLGKVLKRAAVIFLLGFLLYWFPFFESGHMKPLAETRIFGVLQRIALCYLFASLLIHYLKLKGAIIFSAVALLLYHVLLVLFGDLTLEGNAVLKLDTWLIGTQHMYHGEGIAFDPEGLLSTLPAIVNVIAGYAAGYYLQKKRQNFETIAKLLMFGCLLIICALGWDLIFPLNKKLWTSSFVLLTVGIDLMILSVLVYLLDLSKPRKWAYFFEVLGKNTLFIYLLSEVLVIVLYTLQISGRSAYEWIAQNLFLSWLGNYLGSFTFAIFILLTCWTIGFIMDKRKVYIKV